MTCYSPLKGYRDYDTGGLVFKKGSHYTEVMEVACGQCLGCRIDRTLHWAIRIVHESALYEDGFGSTFITLTYRSKEECNESQLKAGHHVPDDYSLDKTHFQKFIKRVRKHFDQKVRYFHCGEYGEENLRPHYHAALFNCSFKDQKIHTLNREGNTYTSELMSKLWPYGFSVIGEINFTTATYIAGYIFKKVTGDQAKEEYLRSDLDGVAYWVKPPYVTMSLKPGIGADFYMKYASDFYPSDEAPVPGKGVVHGVPKYYDSLLKRKYPELLEMVKAARKDFAELHKDDFTTERLESRKICAIARIKKRNL